MIRISQIDDKFSIYKENIVVLLGIGQGTKQLLDLMRYNKIDIHYFCDNNKDNWGKVLEGIPVISPTHLQQLVQSKNNQNSGGGGEIVVQIAISNDATGVDEQLKTIGVKSVISFTECHCILYYLKKLNFIRLSKNYFNDISNIEREYQIKIKNTLRNYIINTNTEDFLILCLPQKTGNNTLKNTLNQNKISLVSLVHSPFAYDTELIKNLNTTVKLITSIREPIIQNLSGMYQHLSGLNGRDRKWDVSFANTENSFKNGGDACEFFRIWDENFGANDFNMKKKLYSTFSIECFFNSFKENILDLSQYPFDKEKGYTIIKEGNIEVFVYQLERMNDIVKEMSDWIGQVPFDKWVMGNEASGKWVANSYKQAQKKITFSQEYFDRCYNDSWVQHFYSQEDIEKFKARWRPHIK